MSKYDEIPFKNNIKQLVNVALMVTKLNKHKFETDKPTLQWYTRVLEKKMVNKIIKTSKFNLDVPITFERDCVWFIAYLMDIKGMLFEEAYLRVLKKENIIYYIDFMGHESLQRNYCGACEGEGTRTWVICDGYAEVDCQECDEGSVECEHCDGDDDDCRHCNGTGLTACEECDGDYSISCPECAGYGNVDCEECGTDTSFENYELEFEVDSYVVIDDRVKEFVTELEEGQETLSHFEKICDNYDPPIEYSFFRSHTAYLRSEYESTDWKFEVEHQGLRFEKKDHKILVNSGFESPDSSVIDDILDEMF